MTPDLMLASISSIIWYFLSIIVFILCILLTVIILVQDSKDTGLTSAFGGAGGGSALLGARMQKDLAKLTAIFGGVLAVCLLIMGFMTSGVRQQSVGAAGAIPPTEKKEAPIEPSGQATAPQGGDQGTGPGATSPAASGAITTGTGTTPPGTGTSPTGTGAAPPSGAPAKGSETPAGTSTSTSPPQK